MATVKHHLNASGGLRRTLVVFAATTLAAMATSCNTSQSATTYPPLGMVVSQTHGSVRARPAYGWPLKPFDRQHAVRAYLNDPRILGSARSFHFGIDIGVPKGRHVPVYAVEAGTVSLVDDGFAIMVRGTTSFAYWHVIPAVHSGEQVRRHQLIGRSMGWNHIHFAEDSGSGWVNPLRPGGLGPYSDATVPTVTTLTFERSGVDLDRRHVRGTCDVVVEAFDTAGSVTPAPWPVTPSLIGWRLVHDGRSVNGWKRVFDSRRNLPDEQFTSVYAAGTAQNHPGVPGRYRFLLAHRWSTAKLRNGRYAIEVQAEDIRGNQVTARVSFTVENGL
jgi:hypothetical protein